MKYMISKESLKKELTCVSPYESGILLLGIGIFLMLEKFNILPGTGILWPIIMIVFGIWFIAAVKFRR